MLVSTQIVAAYGAPVRESLKGPLCVKVPARVPLSTTDDTGMRTHDPRDPRKRRPERYRGPPVTLGHIRSHGVRRLLIYCSTGMCHHSAVVDLIAGRMRPCSWIWTGERFAPSAG
jgi:hypothetical protein